MLTKVGDDVNKGLLEMLGVPCVIEHEDHIQSLRHQLLTQYLPKMKIYEFYQVNIDKYFGLFDDAVSLDCSNLTHILKIYF